MRLYKTTKSKIIFYFLFLSLFGCKEIKKEQKTEPSIIENKNSVVQNDNLNNFIGEYEYKNSETPNENLLLVLKKVDIKTIPNFEGYSWQERDAKDEVVEMTLVGRFYGNTDLFDDAREGYEPGYFVATVQGEPSENNHVKISIHLSSSDILENPINQPIESSEESLKKGNEKWEVTEMNISKELIFEMKKSNELILKSDLHSENLVFKKIK